MKLHLQSVSILILLAVQPTLATAGIFSSCAGGSDTPRPAWVENPAYVIPDAYVATGMALDEGKNLQELRKLSENDAKQHLVEQIEVNIRSENRQGREVSGTAVQQFASSELLATADEELRGMKSQQWVDKDSCMVYTLMTVQVDAVEQAKKEKRSRQHFEQFKSLLAQGTDRAATPAAIQRRKFLEQARLELEGVDFAAIHETYARPVWTKKLADAQDGTSREATELQSRVAVLAINPDGMIGKAIVAKLQGQLAGEGAKNEVMISDCRNFQDCLAAAKARGYGALMLLRIDAKTENSGMGALKGILTLTKTAYDIIRDQARASASASAQVIGWGSADLGWDVAADKAMRALK